MIINILLTIILSSVYLFIVCILAMHFGYFSNVALYSEKGSKKEKIFTFLDDLCEKIVYVSLGVLAVSVFVAIIYSIWFL